MKKLEGKELAQALLEAPGWELVEGKLQREWMFQNFIQSMKFMNQVADIAENAKHHPDIDIRYNRVKLGLLTHDAGGITTSDMAMAAQLNQEI